MTLAGLALARDKPMVWRTRRLRRGVTSEACARLAAGCAWQGDELPRRGDACTPPNDPYNSGSSPMAPTAPSTSQRPHQRLSQLQLKQYLYASGGPRHPIYTAWAVVLYGSIVYLPVVSQTTRKGPASTGRCRRLPMPQLPPPLPTNRAFVVQLRAQPPGAPLSWDGRVEHVVSGQMTHFHSLEELLAFIRRVLAGVQA